MWAVMRRAGVAELPLHGGHAPRWLFYRMKRLAGLASCFLATFVSTCSEMGIRLRKARITAACEIDFNPVFGLREGPINRGEFLVDAEAEGAASLEEALKAAVERCPAVYSLRNAIPVKAALAG